jgi:hypothetical protein
MTHTCGVCIINEDACQNKACQIRRDAKRWKLTSKMRTLCPVFHISNNSIECSNAMLKCSN